MMKKTGGLRVKIVLLTVISTVALTVAIGVTGYIQYYTKSMEKYKNYAETIARMEDHILQEANMGEIIAENDMNNAYLKARSELSMLKTNSTIAYVYAVYFADINDSHSMKYVVNGARPSDLEGVGDYYYSYLGLDCREEDFDQGMRDAFLKCVIDGSKEFGYYENNTVEYGHMLTCYRAIFNEAGKAVGVLAADLDVTDINRDMKAYIIKAIIVGMIITILICMIFIRAIDHYVTKPVMNISRSTGAFVSLMKKNVTPAELIYEPVVIRSKDELSAMSNDITDMADGVRKYMTNLEYVTKEKERIGAELNVATQIQADMLPRIFPAFPDRKEFDLYATMNPAKEVGGDFYDFFMIDDDHLGLVMADVSGKGVPAALFMVIAKTLIKNRALMGGTPSEILSYANDQLCEGNEAELFVTVWMAIIEISTGKGIAANAGHEHPALRRKDGEWELVIYRHSPAVATMEGMRFREHEFELHPGDCLYVYTDGVAEATDAHDELFGPDRMIESLNRDPDATPENLLRNVKSDIDQFVGEAPQFDDITMLGIRWFGATDNDTES